MVEGTGVVVAKDDDVGLGSGVALTVGLAVGVADAVGAGVGDVSVDVSVVAASLALDVDSELSAASELAAASDRVTTRETLVPEPPSKLRPAPISMVVIITSATTNATTAAMRAPTTADVSLTRRLRGDPASSSGVDSSSDITAGSTCVVRSRERWVSVETVRVVCWRP